MRDKILYILGAAALILLARDIYVISPASRTKRNQGAIFKIIFFHVPMAITAHDRAPGGADRERRCS